MVRLISFLLCTIVVPALADADEGTRVPLVAAGSTFSFSARSVPLPTVQLGRIAALAGQGQVDGLPAVRGASADAAPPPGWPAVVLVDGPGVSTGRAPFDGTEAGERCQCKTVIGTPADERIAVLFATTSFHVASPESIELLEVRVD